MGESIAVVSLLGDRLGTSKEAVPFIRRGNGHIGLLLEFPASLFLIIIALILPLRCPLLQSCRVPCQGRSIALDGELLQCSSFPLFFSKLLYRVFVVEGDGEAGFGGCVARCLDYLVVRFDVFESGGKVVDVFFFVVVAPFFFG